MKPNSRAYRFSQRPTEAKSSSGWRSDVMRSTKKAILFAVGLCVFFAAQSDLTAQDVDYPTEQQQEYSQDQTYSNQTYSNQTYSTQAYSPSQQQAAPVQPLNSDQVEQLVAPIALYPDPLVAQILAASTYPQQVQAADQWRQERAGTSPEQIAAEADAQPWDPSVKALTAFPRVLAQMDRNLQWTSDLGNAYYNQPQDVLEAVQVMRRRAEAAGNLQSTPQEVVRDNPGYIEVVPGNPQVVYVPAYNPWTIYGDPITPYPEFSALDVVGDILGGPLRFGVGIAMAAFSSTPWGWLAWGLDWLGHELLFDHSDYYSHSDTVADWGFGHRGFYAYGGRRGFGRGWDHGGMQGEGWRRGGFGGNSFRRGGMGNRGGWNSFSRGNTFARNSRGWNSFARGNTFARNSRGWNSFSGGNRFSDNWRTGSSGFRGLNAVRGGRNTRDRGFGNSFQHNRPTYAANFHRSPDSNFRGSGFGSWSSARSSSSRFGSYKPSRESWGRSGGAFGQRGFGSGRSQRVFGGKSWGGFGSHGGGHSGGGGHSFGGGHSHGGGHSGGHGGHRR